MPKILAIDDINDNLISLKAIIDDTFPDAVVFTALNGQKGIELALDNNPDVILLDVIMPGMDGFEVCRLLKLDEQVRDIPVVFLTALRGDKENRIKALEVGAEGFLSKPIDETELTAQIRAMLKIKAANEQKRNEKDLLKTLVAERTRELENSQAQLKGIFENLQDAYFQADSSDIFTMASPSAVKIFGFESIDEIIGQPAEMLYFDFQDRNSILSVLRSAGRIRDYVCQAKKKDGSPFWVSMNVQLIYGSDGQILGTEGVVRDITERKQAEEELRVSKENFRQIVERSDEIFYRQNLIKGQFEYVSPKTYDILGYTTDEFLALDFKQQCEAIHPEDLPRLINFVNELVEADNKNQKFITREYRIKNKKGKYIWVRGNYILVRDKENNPEKVIGSLADITERKMAAEALQESEVRFRNIFSLSPDSIAISEVETGKYVEVSPSFEKLSGYNREEILGKTSIELGFWVEKEHREDYVNRLKKYGEVNDLEINFRNNKGHIVHTITSTRLIFNSGKSLMLNVIKDITERKMAEKKLQESEAQFREFFEKAADAIFIADFETGIIVDVNEAASRLMLLPHDQIVGLHQSQLHPPVKQGYSKNTFNEQKKIVEGKVRTHSFENELLCSDGSKVPVEIVAAEVNLNGKRCLMGTFRDITDRKKAEESVRLSEERLRLISDSSNDIICSYDLQSRFTSANRTLCEAMQLSKEEIIGKTHEELHFPEAQCKEWAELHENVLTNGHTVFSESTTPMADGTDHFYELALNPLHDSNKKIIGIGVVIRDITERRKATVLLEESHEFNKSLLQTIPFGMHIVDEQGNILFQNEHMENVFSKTAIGCKCWELYRDDKIQCSDCPLLSGFEIGKTAIYETSRVLGGRTFQINHTGMMFQGKKAMLEIFQDITESKEAELALKESEERYRRFISQVSEGVYRFESDEPMDISLPIEEQIDFMYDHLTIAECNDAFLKMYGITSQEEMIGKTFIDLHGGRDNERNRDVQREFVENNYNLQETITEELNAKGQKMYISNTSIGILENNKLIRVWGTQSDISSRIRADQVQQVLYSISNAALTSIDLSELIKLISKEIGKLLDSTNFYIAFHNEETGMLSTLYERDEKDVFDSWPAEKSITGYVIKHQKSMRITFDDVQKLCDTGEIEIFGTPSKVWLGVPLATNKKVIGALVVQSYDDPEAYTEKDKQMLEFISHQISVSIERKKAEQELNEALIKAQESDRLKSAFLANMSHEIRTPLNSIIGFSELMTDPDFDFSQQFDFAKMINASGTNLLAIINDIMDISKIETGQVQVKIADFSVDHLIADIQKEYSFNASMKGVELILDPSNPEDETVLGSDENKIRQVLVNLVGNAIKFTKDGLVEIGIRHAGEFVQFHVRDTGIGIPKEYHHQIFERFRQVESADTRRYGGNGLGLAISKSLVELLGGKIWMESGQGKGSTFYFTIPIH